MSRLSRLGNRLHTGEASVDAVGRRRTWYAVSAVLLLIALSGLVLRGLDPGIDLEGGTEYAVTLPADRVGQDLADELRTEVAGLGIEGAGRPVVTTSGTETILLRTESLGATDADRVSETIQQVTGAGADDIASSDVGPSWDRDTLERALLGLAVFLVLVLLLVRARFREWKASVAALVALGHDVVITVGVCALIGLEVSPATVTGLLAIVAYSLYDTVVVLEKVRENTADLRSRRTTYARAADLAVDQTVVRSVTTTLVLVLPVAAVLGVGVSQPGSGSLTQLALVLFVGVLVAAYSSLFVATPLLVLLKSREKEVVLAEKRATSRSGPRARKPARSTAAPAKQPTRAGSGRPVAPSGSARRAQPTRQTRSKRGRR